MAFRISKLFPDGGERRFGSAVRNFWLLTFEKSIRSILSLLVGTWVLRYLGPEASGSITYVLANLVILAAIAKLGFDPVVVRDVNLKPEKRDVLLGTTLSLLTAASLVTFCLWVLAAAVTSQTPLNFQISLILAMVLLAQPLDVFEWWFQGTGQMGKPVLARVISLILVSAMRVGAILSGAGILVFSALFVVEDWIAGTMNFLFFRKSRVFKLRSCRDYMGTVLRESWPFLLSGLAVTIYTRVDQVILGAMTGNRSVGIFYAAVSLCEALYFLPVAVNTSIYPVLARMKQEKDSHYERIMMRYCNVTLAYSLLITAAVYVLAPAVIPVLFGARYAESTGVLRIYILCFAFVCSGVAQSAWFVNNGRSDIILKKTIAGLATNVSLNLYLIPRFGPNGAAWSAVASQFVSTFGTNFLLDRRFAWMQARSAGEDFVLLAKRLLASTTKSLP